MIRAQSFLVCAAALLALAPVVLAHGDDENMDMGGMGMDMSSSHSEAPTATPTMTADINPELSYFSYPDYKVWIWSHVAVMVVAWCFIAPIGMKSIWDKFGEFGSDVDSCISLHRKVAVLLPLASALRPVECDRCPPQFHLRCESTEPLRAQCTLSDGLALYVVFCCVGSDGCREHVHPKDRQPAPFWTTDVGCEHGPVSTHP